MQRHQHVRLILATRMGTDLGVRQDNQPARGGLNRAEGDDAAAVLAFDPQRAWSREAEQLVAGMCPVPAYRLGWVQATGELSAVELSESDEEKDPVEVLGYCGAGQLDACLSRWTERCDTRRSPLWARGRVRTWRPVAEETQFIQDRLEPAR